MGYRISLYCTPKEQVDAIRNITDKEVDETYGDILSQLEGELIKYDTLANVLDTGNEEKYNLCTRIFNNKLSWESDCSYYTISKEQLKNIIMYICKHNIHDFMVDKSIDYDKKDVGDSFKRHTSLSEGELFDYSLRYMCEEHKNKAMDWEPYSDDENNTYCMNVNVNPDDKWFITDSWSYEYYVFNLVHIYKIFDWENNYLIAIS